MKIFLCGRYSRKHQFRELRTRLHTMGHIVTSRWLDTDWEKKDDSGSSAAPAEYRKRHAVEDLEDVGACDCLIAFTEEPRSNTRGGRHVELGYALACNKIIYLVGPLEHIFCSHPRVMVVTEDRLLEILQKRR